MRGEIPNFIGITDPYEPPSSPEVRYDSSKQTVDEGASMVLEALVPGEGALTPADVGLSRMPAKKEKAKGRKAPPSIIFARRASLVLPKPPPPKPEPVKAAPAVPAREAAKPEPKKAGRKKPRNPRSPKRRPEPKKAEPKKAELKKAEPKKAEPKKAAPGEAQGRQGWQGREAGQGEGFGQGRAQEGRREDSPAREEARREGQAEEEAEEVDSLFMQVDADRWEAIALHSAARYERLRTIVSGYRMVVVAYSGGCDSAFLLRVATDVLGDGALGLTAFGASLAPGERQAARQVASEMTAAHVEIESHEIENPSYASNPTNRCYHCKTELYDIALAEAAKRGIPHVVSGTNADELSDYRPGLKAAAEHHVEHPLAEAGLTKDEIRAWSRRLGLSTWDKPQTP